MKTLGITTMLMWASLSYILYPIPSQDISVYKRFIYHETETYIELLDEEDRREYLRDEKKFLEGRLADGKIDIWVVWSLKLFLLSLGVLAGYLLFAGKRFRLIAIATSSIYLYVWILQLTKRLPAWPLPWFDAYIEYLKRGEAMAEGSLMFQSFFYHQFLVFPLLQFVFIAFCIFWKRDRLW